MMDFSSKYQLLNTSLSNNKDLECGRVSFSSSYLVAHPLGAVIFDHRLASPGEPEAYDPREIPTVWKSHK